MAKNLSKADQQELAGCILDIFEDLFDDLLCKAGIDTSENDANIKGEDYDTASDKIIDTLTRWGLIETE